MDDQNLVYRGGCIHTHLPLLPTAHSHWFTTHRVCISAACSLHALPPHTAPAATGSAAALPTGSGCCRRWLPRYVAARAFTVRRGSAHFTVRLLGCIPYAVAGCSYTRTARLRLLPCYVHLALYLRAACRYLPRILVAGLIFPFTFHAHSVVHVLPLLPPAHTFTRLHYTFVHVLHYILHTFCILHVTFYTHTHIYFVHFTFTFAILHTTFYTHLHTFICYISGFGLVG